MAPSHHDTDKARTPKPWDSDLLIHARDCELKRLLEASEQRTDTKLNALATKTEAKLDATTTVVNATNTQLAGLNATVRVAGLAITLAVGAMGGLSYWAIRGISAQLPTKAASTEAPSIWLGTAYATPVLDAGAAVRPSR